MYAVTFICLYIFTCCFYLGISKGLAGKQKFLKSMRFLSCALLAVFPAALADLPLTSGLCLSSFFAGLAWTVTYPFLYWLTNRKTAGEFYFHVDVVFGLYVIAWLTSLKILVLSFGILPAFFMAAAAVIEFILILLPLSQYCYYLLYGTCIDANGMLLIEQTDLSETLEFIKSLPAKFVAASLFAAALIFALLLKADLNFHEALPLNGFRLLLTAFIFLFLTVYLYFWKKKTPRKYNLCVFLRTGIVRLFFDIRDYLKTSALYAKNTEERVKDLSVAPSVPPFDRPSAIMLIIGESASRDYMSAFTDCPYDSTPWLRQKKDDPHFILFPHAYSCASYTLGSLERALTEFNQYDGGQFNTSVSVIDIAKKAGYKTSWFSNQGHIVSFVTALTSLADTADTALWTGQGAAMTPSYDDAVLKLLDGADPKENNFIIIHLMGSHVNYRNRYPKEFTRWGSPDGHDLISEYLNSLAYTDCVLEKIYDYAKEKLNLQALLYFSDHAAIPDNRRSPNFSGFGEVRIPMFAYFSDEYMDKNRETYETLKLHGDYYFTNDLVYELVCSILGITSGHFDETGSLASPKYRYTREILKTDCGRRFIRDDSSGGL